MHQMDEINTYNGRTIFDRWILPKIELNKGTRYEEEFVGNSPKFMPLDNSLNRDIQLAHDRHCILTNHLPKDDIRRFSKAIPNLIDRGVRRIWDHLHGVPFGSRIVHDIEKAANAMLFVMMAKGKMVPNLVNRNGHRNEKAGQSTYNRCNNSRSNKKDWEKECWENPIICDVVKQRQDMIVAKYAVSESD